MHDCSKGELITSYAIGFWPCDKEVADYWLRQTFSLKRVTKLVYPKTYDAMELEVSGRADKWWQVEKGGEGSGRVKKLLEG